MTRFNRCSRIGGRTAKTRRRAPGAAFVAALAASLAVLAIGGAGSLAPTGAVFAQTPGTGGPVSRGNPACNWREVFLYDVVVNGSKSGTETVRDTDGKGSSFSFHYAYSAFYSRVPVTVEHNCSGDIKIDGPTDRDPHPGEASLDFYHWTDSITRTIRIPTGGGRAFSIDGPRGVFENQIVTCSFDVAIGGLRAQIELNGFIPGSPGGRAPLVVDSLLRPGEDRLEALIRARRETECDKGMPSHASVFDSLPYASGRGEGSVQFYNKPIEVAGVELDPPLLNLPGIIGTRDGDSAEARKLARGESFSVASGPRTHESADVQGTVRAATSMTVTFSRVLPPLHGCGSDTPERGMIYAGTLDGRTRSEPSSNSSVVDSPPSGARLRFTRTQRVNGQTWYYIEPSGRPPGWFSAEQASCTRPTNAPQPRIVKPLPAGLERYPSTTPQVSAGRG